MGKRAVVTGALGQDGSYLTEHLLNNNYDVYGVYRRISTGQPMSNIQAVLGHPRLHLVEGDITDSGFMFGLVKDVQPDEFYNLAAMSHVGRSFTEPLQTFRVDAEAVMIQLEAIRLLSKDTRYYQASTSELYGGLHCPAGGYTESSVFNPRSPYAIAKLAAYSAVQLYRGAYGLFTCNGILFNHESPRRGEDFATRKITQGVAKIKLGLQEHLRMGNLEASRDIGHADDYIKAMQMMLQQEAPDDYVVATGESVTIRQMLQYVCKLADLKLDDVYRQDERYMRPSEVPYLKGDPTRMKSLGWAPTYDWKALLREMYEHDLAQLT